MADLIEQDGITGATCNGASRQAGGWTLTRIEDHIFVPRRLCTLGLALLPACGVIFLAHIWLRDWPITASGHHDRRRSQGIPVCRVGRRADALRRDDEGDYPYYHLVQLAVLFPLGAFILAATLVLVMRRVYASAVPRRVPA